MEVYEVVKSIGSGNFGQVYLVRHKYEGRNYVVKKIKTRDMNDKDRENTEQEVRLLQKLRHANIVAYKDSYIDREQYLCIVMVYCEGGDIYLKIKDAKGKKFSEAQILEWIAQILLALLYLHERKILHRDLKTQNIFIKNGKIRLGDFGIAKVLDGTKDFANTCIGTPYYMSPELFKNKPYSYKSDVWAFGCVIYEMMNLRHAFDAQSLNGLAMKILKGSYPPTSPFYSKGLRDIVTKMLSVNPSQRPTLIDLLNTPLIRRHVVIYLRDCLTPTTEPKDLDDINVDSLKDQAERYGLMPLINGESKMPQPIQRSEQQIEAKLKKEEEEKQEMEVLLSKLTAQKKEIKSKLKQNINKVKQQETEKANELEKQQKQKQVDAEKRRDAQLQEKRKKAKAYNKRVEDNSKSEEDKRQEESTTARDRVIAEKEKRRKEEEDRKYAELMQIHQQNQYNRQVAVEMHQAQFRTSSILQSALTYEKVAPNLTEEELKEVAEYEEESTEAQTDEEELKKLEELRLINQQVNDTIERIQVKTIRIEEMRESLRFSKSGMSGFEPDPPDEVEEINEENSPEVNYGELEAVEELEEEEAKEELPSWHSKLREKLKLLQHKCEAGIGHQLYERSLNLLKEMSGHNNDAIRSALIELLGINNIGYWVILDQIIVIESSLT
ncbi:unnamed protein product [Blepharisma stoltei]|uniref:non-specific serine/threonine protein kinase n=1 Tax=Blepharisma stoltei TaxID=1481888 RepID=A0AAU9IEC8_9CILI|nr:unnamed protein product [Blepharisma stoltei]